jgi:hypothetical protein
LRSEIGAITKKVQRLAEEGLERCERFEQLGDSSLRSE